MHLQQLYKVLQDRNTTDELMLFIPAVSSTISCVSSSNVQFTTEFIFLAERTQEPFRTSALRNVIYPALNIRTIKALLYMIVLSPHIICLDRLQSKLVYTKVMR